MFYIILSLSLFLSVVSNILFLEQFTLDNSINNKNIIFISYFISSFFFILFLFLLFFYRKKNLQKIINKNISNLLLLFFSILISMISIEIILTKYNHYFIKRVNYAINYEFIANYKYNKQGFRDKEFNFDKDEIFFIGDSFVFGSAVDDPFTIDKLVEKNYFNITKKNINILNLGIPGADISDYSKVLKKYINPNTKKIFVFIYVDNDIFLNFDNNSFKLKIIKFLDNLNFLNLISNLLIKDKVLSEGFYKNYSLNKKYKKIFKSKLANPHLLSLKFRGNFSQYYDEMVTWFKESKKKNINEIINISKQNNSILYFVLIPSKFQVKKKYQELPAREFGYIFNKGEIVNNNIQKYIIEWFNKKNVEVIDLLPLLKTSNKFNYYFIDDHFNKYGNTLTSKELINYID